MKYIEIHSVDLKSHKWVIKSYNLICHEKYYMVKNVKGFSIIVIKKYYVPIYYFDSFKS